MCLSSGAFRLQQLDQGLLFTQSYVSIAAESVHFSSGVSCYIFWYTAAFWLLSPELHLKELISALILKQWINKMASSLHLKKICRARGGCNEKMNSIRGAFLSSPDTARTINPSDGWLWYCDDSRAWDFLSDVIWMSLAQIYYTGFFVL